MKRFLFACTLLATSSAVADTKIAPATQAKADVLFEKAQGHYQAGKFQAAIPLFKEAYELVHDPVYLFNVAQSYRKVLDCESASDYYNRYLEAATDADPKQREKVQGWLRELQPCVEERQKAADAVKRAEEAEQKRKAEEAARQPAAGGARSVEVDRGRTLRMAGLAIGGVGAVGITVGVLFSIKGRSYRNELADVCGDLDGCDWSDPAVRDKDDAGKRANTYAAIGWIGGGVAALTGAGLYVWGRTKIERVVVTPTSGGATVSARLRF